MAMGINRRPATEEEARALASAIRVRILRLCLELPLTNKEIAGRLNANPATTLHHVRKLVDTGFLRAEASRKGPRGSTEIPYRATGKSWEMDVAESGVAGGAQAMLDAFLAEIRLTDVEQAVMSRLGLRLTDQEREELVQRVGELFDEIAARPPSPGGTPYSLFFAMHHDPSRDPAPDPDRDPAPGPTRDPA